MAVGKICNISRASNDKNWRDGMTDVDHKFIPPYEGEDMAGFVMEHGFKLSDDPFDKIKSITNVRSVAIIVSDSSVYLIEPFRETGFCIKIIAHLY